MATKKFTKAETAKLTKQIQDAVEKAKRQNKHENFRGLTEEDIAKKLNRVNSPMFVAMGWSNTTLAGTESVSLTILNPDPGTAVSLYVHLWVGSGDVDPNTGTFLLNVDPRFPRLTEPSPIGLSLPTGGSSALNFAFTVPANVERTTYLGSACLMQVDYLDTGLYLDRACFPFRVS